MAESRGTKEDQQLKMEYSRFYEQGSRFMSFQSALTSKELKVKPKSQNIAGLQLADILAKPLKMAVLREHELDTNEPSEFERILLKTAEPKLNIQFYSGKVDGYGKVLYPRRK